MIALFYGASCVAVLATALAISRAHAVHALLYLVVSLLGVALVMLSLGAAFAAALEVMVYAGAIMVLFVFVIMLLHIGPETEAREKAWIAPRYWIGPGLLSGFLLILLLQSVTGVQAQPAAEAVAVKKVGITLYGPWLLAVELGSVLLLAGLISAFHLGRRT